jgi:rhamnosyltransferase
LSDFTVIIRVKDEARWIGHAIQSCIDFLDGPEIVIVDNNSSDESVDIARLFRQDPHLDGSSHRYCEVKTISISDYSPGRALNLGVKHASRGYIVILSSHCVITRFDLKYVKSLLDIHQACFGKQIPHFKGKRITPRYIWSHFTDSETINMFSALEGRYFFHNAFSIITKEFLEKNPFDEELVSKEDRYWASDIVTAGHSFIYTNKIVADHHYTLKGNTWKAL